MGSVFFRQIHPSAHSSRQLLTCHLIYHHLEVCFIDLSPVFAFPSTIGIETVEVSDQIVLVHLHAISPTAPCPL
jgi:hypothetical protein